MDDRSFQAEQWIARPREEVFAFEDRDGGTLVGDRVLYRLPLGRLGHLAAGALVARDVRLIFDYRRRAIERLLAPA